MGSRPSTDTEHTMKTARCCALRARSGRRKRTATFSWVFHENWFVGQLRFFFVVDDSRATGHFLSSVSEVFKKLTQVYLSDVLAPEDKELPVWVTTS